MEFHRGRLFDHVHLRVSNVEASKRFYQAVFTVLGLSEILQEGPGFFYADELFVNQADDYISRIHLAFQAQDPETVKDFYNAAISAGGRDNGPPGERAYHPGYFAAFVLDPDGNNIEVVYHGLSERTAASVVIKPK